MSYNIEKLRVAVVPIAPNNIDQRSSVEDILNNSTTRIYYLPDYFDAQNNEELESHWSFLIDIETRTEIPM